MKLDVDPLIELAEESYVGVSDAVSRLSEAEVRQALTFVVSTSVSITGENPTRVLKTAELGGRELAQRRVLRRN